MHPRTRNLAIAASLLGIVVVAVALKGNNREPFLTPPLPDQLVPVSISEAEFDAAFPLAKKPNADIFAWKTGTKARLSKGLVTFEAKDLALNGEDVVLATYTEKKTGLRLECLYVFGPGKNRNDGTLLRYLQSLRGISAVDQSSWGIGTEMQSMLVRGEDDELNRGIYSFFQP
ncbi:MAG: hypothetical protein ACOYON_15895 [Fimbriimonas sp.]